MNSDVIFLLVAMVIGVFFIGLLGWLWVAHKEMDRQRGNKYRNKEKQHKSEQEGGKYWLSDRNFYIYDKMFYNPKTNTYEGIEAIPVRERQYFTSISRKEYEENTKFLKNKICDCPVGDGFNIVEGEAYSPIDVFIELLNEKELEGFNLENEACFTSYGTSYRRRGSLTMEHKEHSTTFDITDYHKKACLNCKKCLDEKQQLIDILLDAKNKLLKMEADQAEVLRICEG